MFRRGNEDSEIRYEETFLGKDFDLCEREVSFLLTEYTPLREQVNHTVDRLSQNEFACVAFVAAAIVFQHTQQPQSGIPEAVLYWSSAAIALVVSLGGKVRSESFRRHMRMLERYLKDIERRMSKKLGWTNFYEDATKNTRIPRQMGSRNLLWAMLIFLSFANLCISLGPFLPDNISF